LTINPQEAQAQFFWQARASGPWRLPGIFKQVESVFVRTEKAEILGKSYIPAYQS
jgi:hypothetical protein